MKKEEKNTKLMTILKGKCWIFSVMRRLRGKGECLGKEGRLQKKKKNNKKVS